MMLMFAKWQEYAAISPGYIHVPMTFDTDSLNDFIKNNLEIHRQRSAKFVLNYQEFEEVSEQIKKITVRTKYFLVNLIII